MAHSEPVYTVEITNTLPPAWSKQKIIPLDHETNYYVLVSKNQLPAYSLSFHDAQGLRESILWDHWVVVGYEDFVRFIDRENLTIKTIQLGEFKYFGHLYPLDDRLLVATWDDLLSLDSEAKIQWRTPDRIGVDGVIVSEIKDGRIFGSGEWDPPGDWQPFIVDLGTGAIIEKGGSRI